MRELQESPVRERTSLADPLTPGGIERVDAATREPSMTSRALTAGEPNGAFAPSTDSQGRGPESRASRVLSSPAVLLGAVGMAGGALALGALAYRVAHPLPMTALIATLGGVAGGAAGAALPALARAIKWSIVAALTLAVGAAALLAIHRLDPLLIRQFIPRW